MKPWMHSPCVAMPSTFPRFRATNQALAPAAPATLAASETPSAVPGPDDPLPGRHIGNLRRDRDRPAAGNNRVDRLHPVETVPRPRPPPDAGPAAGEADRHRIRLPVTARVEPAGDGHRMLEDLPPGALGAPGPGLVRGRLPRGGPRRAGGVLPRPGRLPPRPGRLLPPRSGFRWWHGCCRSFRRGTIRPGWARGHPGEDRLAAGSPAARRCGRTDHR